MENLIYNDFMEKLRLAIDNRREKRNTIFPASSAAWYLENFNPFDALMSAANGKPYGQEKNLKKVEKGT